MAAALKFGHVRYVRAETDDVASFSIFGPCVISVCMRAEKENTANCSLIFRT